MIEKNGLTKGISIGIGLALAVLLVYMGFRLLSNRTSQASATITSAKATSNSQTSLDVEFETGTEAVCSAEAQINGETISASTDDSETTSHALTLDALEPNTSYSVVITCGETTRKLTAKTSEEESSFNFGAGNVLPTIAKKTTKSQINGPALKKCIADGGTVQSCADTLEAN